MKRRIVYGVANYEELVRDNGYFVDKTMYIEKLEQIKNPVFLRPKRFGKSLFCRILECYYNIGQKEDFESLFGQTYVGKHATALRNSCFVLHLDFSTIDATKDFKDLEASFNFVCNLKIHALISLNSQWFQQRVTIDEESPASANLQAVLDYVAWNQFPPLYIIIDEYDNFANQLILAHKDHFYARLMADDSFFKTFFKTLKEGRKTGVVQNVFITGVLPLILDDLASGFNIASIITLDPEFENMMGFTQQETDTLLDAIYQDYGFDPATRSEVESIIKTQYNGYHFITPHGESLYNSTILMYFLDYFCRHHGEIPEYLIDMNLRTDLSWVRRLTGSTQVNTEAFVDQLTMRQRIAYDKRFLVSKFNKSKLFDKDFFPISFYHLGMLTKQDDFFLTIPNWNMREIFVEYFNELHQIDVSTQYAEMMQGFIKHLELPRLFADYWRLYVSQLPEAIFQQVNENFYRTTFYELCSRYLSRWFTWNIERSYPKGRTDLEFVGKYHEQFAGVRMVIEFKYYSNTDFKKFKTTIEAFQLQKEDTRQIAGYVEGLLQEYPEARVSQFVIYCMGNQGFRVFEVPLTD